MARRFWLESIAIERVQCLIVLLRNLRESAEISPSLGDIVETLATAEVFHRPSKGATLAQAACQSRSHFGDCIHSHLSAAGRTMSSSVEDLETRALTIDVPAGFTRSSALAANFRKSRGGATVLRACADGIRGGWGNFTLAATASTTSRRIPYGPARALLSFDAPIDADLFFPLGVRGS